jgi:hypothetical protein
LLGDLPLGAWDLPAWDDLEAGDLPGWDLEGRSEESGAESSRFDGDAAMDLLITSAPKSLGAAPTVVRASSGWCRSTSNDSGPTCNKGCSLAGTALVERMSGGVLLSHPVSRAVPSALKGLASGFGM